MSETKSGIKSRLEPFVDADWQTIWQNELAAKAVDREVLEGMVIAAQSWSTAVAAFQELMHESQARDGVSSAAEPPAGAGSQAGPSPSDAASGDGGAEIERLTLRVAELERQLAEFDRKPVSAKRRRPPA